MEPVNDFALSMRKMPICCPLCWRKTTYHPKTTAGHAYHCAHCGSLTPAIGVLNLLFPEGPENAIWTDHTNPRDWPLGDDDLLE